VFPVKAALTRIKRLFKVTWPLANKRNITPLLSIACEATSCPVPAVPVKFCGTIAPLIVFKIPQEELFVIDPPRPNTLPLEQL
jgi:hypothetical protein